MAANRTNTELISGVFLSDNAPDPVSSNAVVQLTTDTILGTAATSATLSINGTAQISAIDTATDQDWWRVTLNAGTSYTFRLDKTAISSLDALLRLVDSAGNQLAINNDGGGNFNALITYTPPRAARFICRRKVTTAPPVPIRCRRPL